MKRIIICFALAVILICSATCAVAKRGEEHEKDLEKALLGTTINTDINQKSSDQSDMNIMFGYLEDAIYLCIDQAGNDGQQWLDELNNNLQVSGLPKTVSEFSVPKSSDHQAYTHMGWDFKLYEEKSHWGIRQNILLATVSKVFNFPVDESKQGNERYDPQCVAMAKLIYYIHILGDHVADSFVTRLNVIQLSKLGDDYGLLQELRKCLKDLLIESRNSMKYAQLRVSLDAIRVKARILGEDDNETKQEKVKVYAQQALDTLFRYLPKLLKEEPFFSKVFSYKSDI